MDSGSNETVDGAGSNSGKDQNQVSSPPRRAQFDDVLGQGGASRGMSALREATGSGEGKTLSEDEIHHEPRTVAGKALVPTEELLESPSGDQTAQRVVERPREQEQKRAEGEGEPKTVEERMRELQSRYDRLQRLYEDSQTDALIGSYVNRDGRLRQIVTDHMTGASGGSRLGPYFTPDGAGQQQDGSVEESVLKELGLPPDFEVIEEDVHRRGTDSYRFAQAMEQVRTNTVVDSVLQQLDKRKAEQALDEARAEFLKNHSNEELDDLMKWINEPQNWSLDRFWLYRRAAEAQETQRGREKPDNYRPSIGAGAGVEQVPIQQRGPTEEELSRSHQERLLNYSRKNKMPWQGEVKKPGG